MEKREKHCDRQKALHLSEAFLESCSVLVLGVDTERDADNKVAGRTVDVRELYKEAAWLS